MPSNVAAPRSSRTTARPSSAAAVAAPFEAAAAALDGRAVVREGRGAATFDGTAADYLDAYREATRR